MKNALRCALALAVAVPVAGCKKESKPEEGAKPAATAQQQVDTAALEKAAPVMAPGADRPARSMLSIVQAEIALGEGKPARAIELLLPNINRIAANSITLIESNRGFIEAYMVGLNHEFARKLQTADQTSILGDPRAPHHLPVLPKW